MGSREKEGERERERAPGLVVGYAMQANKDEAVKCLNIARRALREGNADKARRFCDKAKRLGGDTLAEQVSLVINDIEATSSAKNGGGGPTTSGTSSAKGNADDLRRRAKR